MALSSPELLGHRPAIFLTIQRCIILSRASVLPGIPCATEAWPCAAESGLFDVLPLPYQFILLETQAVPFFQYTGSRSMTPALLRPLTFPLVPAADITGNKIALHLYRIRIPTQLRHAVESERPVPTQLQSRRHGRLCGFARCPPALPRGRSRFDHPYKNLCRLPLAASGCPRECLCPGSVQSNRSQRQRSRFVRSPQYHQSQFRFDPRRCFIKDARTSTPSKCNWPSA